MVSAKVQPLLPRGRLLQDSLGRPLRDLRLSVIDRCNFRCPYCMPREHFHDQYRFLKSSERLDFNELLRLTRLFVQLGVVKLRVTGGEPLLRPGLADLVGDLTGLTGIKDVALTTNGVLLAQHAAELRGAGLQRVTVSLDSLDPAVFARMSGGYGSVKDVLDGIAAAERAGLSPIKVNAVVERGVNDHTVLDLVEHFRGSGVIVRLIEYMDVGNRNDWNRERVVPSQQLFERIHARWPRGGRVHLLGYATVLRRLLARAPVLGRQVLHLPVRGRGHRSAGAAARRCQRRGAAAADARGVGAAFGPLQ